jgi:hypothetical protein
MKVGQPLLQTTGTYFNRSRLVLSGLVANDELHVALDLFQLPKKSIYKSQLF